MSAAEWGSDAIAQTLRQTGVPYVALNPGASFRGLHDSLVNFLGNRDPQILLCLHEEHAVAIAHGYAKVSGEPLAVVLHSNVGLMHASMAIFNAFCDRVPVLALGATGPLAAERRRPWIDWIHTASDMPALVRNFVKWDDQPTSVDASVDSILRANQLARAYPAAPVYVCVDAAVQEQPVSDWSPKDPRRYQPPSLSGPDVPLVRKTVDLLADASNPVILMGRTSRDETAWQRRVSLAELLEARVLTDLKLPAAFPTSHVLHGDAPANALSPSNQDLLRSADVVLALEWEDLGGTLGAAWGTAEPEATVIAVGSEHSLFNGWTKNDYRVSAVDVQLNCHPDVAVAALLEAVTARDSIRAGTAPAPGATGDMAEEEGARTGTPGSSGAARDTATVTSDVRERTATSHAQAGPSSTISTGRAASGDEQLTVRQLARTLRTAVGRRKVTLTQVPTSWEAQWWPFTEPLSYLGRDGGGGIGAGPGITVGAALALRDADRLPIGILGDGDTLMGLTALWTASAHNIPLLVIVANNGSFFNDELHQDRMAAVRGRPRKNAHVGMRIEGPAPDIAHMATDMGVVGIGPITDAVTLEAALKRAITIVESGKACVVDVTVARGYPPLTEAAVLNDRGGSVAELRQVGVS